MKRLNQNQPKRTNDEEGIFQGYLTLLNYDPQNYDRAVHHPYILHYRLADRNLDEKKHWDLFTQAYAKKYPGLLLPKYDSLTEEQREGWGSYTSIFKGTFYQSSVIFGVDALFTDGLQYFQEELNIYDDIVERLISMKYYFERLAREIPIMSAGMLVIAQALESYAKSLEKYTYREERSEARDQEKKEMVDAVSKPLRGLSRVSEIQEWERREEEQGQAPSSWSLFGWGNKTPKLSDQELAKALKAMPKRGEICDKFCTEGKKSIERNIKERRLQREGRKAPSR